MPVALPNLKVKLASFPGISWPISKIAAHDNGVAVGRLEFPSVSAEVQGSTLMVPVAKTSLNVIPGHEDGFINFIANLITKPSHTFAVGGNTDVWFKLPSLSENSASSGADSSKTLTVTNVGLSGPVTIRGLNNFPEMEYVELVSLTKDADSDVTTAETMINIHNPSELSMKLGDLVFNMLNDIGDLVGVVKIPNLHLAIGDNVVPATVTFSDLDVYDTLTAKSNTFTIVGFEGSSKHFVATKALCSFRSHITIPKLETA
ncbi:hypothetical protein BX616_007245 [Lobosporangium transversale]|nr:hypothetical protein BX616_007245 [Lobosporangium transversale]